MTEAAQTITYDGELAQKIQETSGQNVFLCYQCKKCTAGCPAAEYFDLTPHRMMRALQFGQVDTVLQSKTLWLCASCEACHTRCPQGLDLPRIVDALRIIAVRQGVTPAVRTVPAFYTSALRGIKLFGRMYEAGLMAELYLRMFLSGDLDRRQLVSQDIPLAVKMLRTGKLKVLPPLSRSAKYHSKAAATAKQHTVAYYPGCSLHSTGIEYELSTRAVAEKIGLELVEPDGWVCCGTTPAHSTDHVLSTVMPLKTLQRVEQAGHSRVTVPCPSCFVRLRTALHDVAADQHLAEQVTAKTGYSPSPGLEVEHLLTTITEQVGIDTVSAAMVRSLGGLRVVCYYGCVITRPPDITGATEYEYPMNMDRLMGAMGAECRDWSYKTECCGGSLQFGQLAMALDMSRKVLLNARDVGAEAIVVACPLCHANLDIRQRQIAAQYHETYDMPILYFTQLMALALGVTPTALGFEKHAVSARPLLQARGLWPAHDQTQATGRPERGVASGNGD